jgi:hypothetical protein
MARLTLRLLLLVSVFALLITVIRRNSVTSDSVFAAYFRRDLTCPQPCWHGIQLGKTTVAEAYDLLRSEQSVFTNIERPYEYYVTWQFASLPSDKASLVHLGSHPGNEIQAVRFEIDTLAWQRKDIFTIADAIQLWGTPLSSHIFYCSYGDANRAMMKVYFEGNIQVTSTTLFNDWRGKPVPSLVHITPTVPLAHIEYYADSNNMIPRPSGKWRGFKDVREDSLNFTNLC